MESTLRLILGIILVVAAALSIISADIVPVDLSLPIRIAFGILGLWLISGKANVQAYFILRLLIGGIFVYAAIDKIIHPDQFARIIYNYHILPGQLINIFALVLPWVELISGLFIIIGYWEKASAVLIGGLLVMFVFALSLALIKGVNIECGCFSTTSRAKGPVQDLIIRDAILLIATGLIFVARSTWIAVEKKPSLGWVKDTSLT